MKTIIKIAWRNVWRNKLRSSIVFTSVVLGIWAGLFVLAISFGMLAQQKRGMLESQLSHIQIHTDTYLEDVKLDHKFSDSQINQVEAILSKNKDIINYSKRSIIEGTGTTAHGFSNLKVIGVTPEIEKQVTSIHSRLIEGTYFSKYKNRPVLIGRQLAEELHLEVGKTMNISFQDKDHNFIEAGFKVEGIFSTPSQSYDKSNVFIKSEDFTDLIASENPFIHEYAINLTQVEKSSEISKLITTEIKDATAQNWAIISPQLSYMHETSEASLMVILVIIVFALTFGIVNTMLMAILERKRELGMMLCVGMNKKKVFLMIVIETLFLSIAAAPIGLLISWISITYFGKVGINLDSVGEALYKVGYDSMVFTEIESSAYINITVMIIVASLIASIIPARKALKYNPAEAVRAV